MQMLFRESGRTDQFWLLCLESEPGCHCLTYVKWRNTYVKWRMRATNTHVYVVEQARPFRDIRSGRVERGKMSH